MLLLAVWACAHSARASLDVTIAREVRRVVDGLVSQGVVLKGDEETLIRNAEAALR
jgi:hypothetical protein